MANRANPLAGPYICDFPGCGKSFSIPGGLRIHKRAHSGEKPFKCTEPGCNKAFAESSNLAKHVRTLHAGSRDCISRNFTHCRCVFIPALSHFIVHIRVVGGALGERTNFCAMRRCIVAIKKCNDRYIYKFIEERPSVSSVNLVSYHDMTNAMMCQDSWSANHDRRTIPCSLDPYCGSRLRLNKKCPRLAPDASKPIITWWRDPFSGAI